MAIRILHNTLAALPLLVTPLLFFLLAEGRLNAGGGEKDIVLVLPWLLWSLIFLFSALVLIRRHWPLRRWVLHSGCLSTGLLLILWILAYLASVGGIL